MSLYKVGFLRIISNGYEVFWSSCSQVAKRVENIKYRFFCKKGVAAEKSPLTSADQRIDKIFTKYDES